MAALQTDRLTALVIEDDILIARLLREIVTAHGLEVAEVCDGSLGSSGVRALQPDIVLLDLGLPGVHGLDILDEIKGDPDMSHIPVVVVTAWFTPELEGRARALGAAGVVGKPFDAACLTAAIDAALAGEPAPIVNH